MPPTPPTKRVLFDVWQWDESGTCQLTLLGELDIRTAPLLNQRLEQLKRARTRVSVDLSRLEFMDGAGVRAVLDALVAAREDGWELTVREEVSLAIGELIRESQLEQLIWPDRAL